MLRSINNWHKSTRLGRVVFAVVDLAIAYGFFSLSLNSGNLIWYIVTIVFLIGFLANIYKLIESFFRG